MWYDIQLLSLTDIFGIVSDLRLNWAILSDRMYLWERERFISSHNIVIQTERVGGLLQDLRIPNLMLSSVKRLLVTIATAVNPIKRNTNLKPRSQPGRLNQLAPRTWTTQPSPWSPTRRKFSGRELDLPTLPSEWTPPSLFIRHYLFTLLSYTLWRGPSPLDAKYIVPGRKIVVFSSLFSRVIFLMSPQIVCLKWSKVA